MTRDLGLLQKIIRLYTFYTPVKKGKYRLSAFGNRLVKKFPKEILTITNDGRKFAIYPSLNSYPLVYFLGEFEAAITHVFNNIIKPGDICLDIGANLGWYTTLLQGLVGENGKVYAFEPVPGSYELLKKNVELNLHPERVVLNNIALGDDFKEVKLHLFKDLPDGHASISTLDNTNYEIFPARMITLDSYLEENEIGEVNFVKADIEGAELMMLKGASRLFRQKKPPIWEIEMALGTTKCFGYLPDDLIKYISRQREYDFYEIDESNFVLKPIEGFAPASIGANVLCVPKEFYRERLNSLKILK